MHTLTTLTAKIEALGLSEIVRLDEPFVKGTVQVIVTVENVGAFHARNFDLAESYVLGVFAGQCLGKNYSLPKNLTFDDNRRGK